MTALFELNHPEIPDSSVVADHATTDKHPLTVADINVGMTVDAELGRSRVIAIYRVSRRHSDKPAMRVEFEIDGYEYTRLLNLDDVMTTPPDAAFRRWMERAA